MAQIKKIVKPGDLIRGASVGLAGLDKDGNVVGYKAAAADAGKVLTVGVDGSVAPAEGGSDSLYRHQVEINITGGTYEGLSITGIKGLLVVYNRSNTPLTKQSILDLIASDEPLVLPVFPSVQPGYLSGNHSLSIQSMSITYRSATSMYVNISGIVVDTANDYAIKSVSYTQLNASSSNIAFSDTHIELV